MCYMHSYCVIFFFFWLCDERVMTIYIWIYIRCSIWTFSCRCIESLLSWMLVSLFLSYFSPLLQLFRWPTRCLAGVTRENRPFVSRTLELMYILSVCAHWRDQRLLCTHSRMYIIVMSANNEAANIIYYIHTYIYIRIYLWNHHHHYYHYYYDEAYIV